jgi:hypothetical protein
MYARYLPAACCWRVFFGSSLSDIRGTRHWSTKEWLKADLRAAGLKMDDETGEITTIEA